MKMETEKDVKRRPIIFSGESVPRILARKKTQTRRIESQQPVLVDGKTWEWPYPTEKRPDGSWKKSKASWADGFKYVSMPQFCPYGQPGDRLWVKEIWRVGAWQEDTDRIAVDYKADGYCRPEWIEVLDEEQFSTLWEQSTNDARKVYGEMERYHWKQGESPCRWRNPRYMPRWASRVELVLLDAGLERLQDISEEDALADGGWIYAKCPIHKAPIESYRAVWNVLNAKRGYPWESNPWVWRLRFELIDKR